MKPSRLFTSLRIMVSTAIALLILLALADLWSIMPSGVVRLATWFQFLPSFIRAIACFGLLSMGFLLVLGLTLVFGRVYCSFLCPLGAFMDGVLALRKKMAPIKFSHKRPGYLRYLVLAGLAVSLFAGNMILVNILDPYSIFTRTGQAMVRPAVIGLNNALAQVGEAAGYYGISPYPWKTFSLLVLGPVFAWLALVVWLGAKHGRLYCNTLCPVGAFLGIFSRFSVLKISIATGNCVQCGLCSKTCKASCMDHELSCVDHSRCVMCLDCLNVCPTDAVVFSNRLLGQDLETNAERRGFLAMTAMLLAGIPGRALGAGVDENIDRSKGNIIGNEIPEGPGAGPPLSAQPIKREFSIVPPGGKSQKHFASACTACHLCVAACPSQIIMPRLMSYQGLGLMMPVLSYDKGFCNYNCNACTQVCPSGAIMPVGMEDKKRIQIGQAQFLKQNCVVATQKTECVACAEHCPTGAVKIVREKGGPGLPKVDTEVCVGCGACEFACPARPHKAIYVKANPVQGTALPPKKDKSIQSMVGEDFPF